MILKPDEGSMALSIPGSFTQNHGLDEAFLCDWRHIHNVAAYLTYSRGLLSDFRCSP